MGASRVRVALPTHLRRLAGSGPEVVVEVEGPVTIRSVMDALERHHPTLRGTIRDHGQGPRRAYMRYFACGEDLSHEPEETPLPRAILDGEEAFRVLGAISGG